MLLIYKYYFCCPVLILDQDFNAAQLSHGDCDRLHAEAGGTAAKEAKDLWEKEGMAARPTQYFWGRLQQSTQTLPCVKINN